jgi:hypothetical protein
MIKMCMMLIIIVGFTLVWEWGTEQLEEAIALQPHYVQIVSKVYRELMILGFISLSLLLSIEFDLIHYFHIDHVWLLSFEFAHLLIFAVAMIYVVNALVASHRLNITKRNWQRIANTETDDITTAMSELDPVPSTGFAAL